MANLQDNIRISTQVDMQQLDILISKLTQLGVNLTSVSSQARNLQSSLNQTTQATNQQTAATNQQVAATNNLVGQTNRATQANNGLFQSLNSLTKLRSELITLFGAYSIGSFAQQMVEAQSKVESFQLGMKNLLGEKFGAKLTDDLKKFTVETPLNFENVINYTNKLVGAFKATGASSREIQEQVTPILESLGNTAAALGGGDRLGRLIYAFTQVQATGRLMGTEVRQITETGFPLLAVMAQQSGKSVQELQKDISDGKVGFEQFQKAILSAGKEGGVFAGAMDIMANTVQGRIDKLKEQVFFALSNIGNQFNDSAKKAVDFGASIIQSLFGTESATKRTIDVIRNAVIAWATYELIIRKNSAAQVAWNAIQRIGLIIKGEAILATEAYTGMTIAETEAQIAATTAARGFNATLAANPFGFALLALTALVTAYQLYSDTVDEARDFTLQGVKANDSDVKSLVAKQSQLNATAKSVLGLTEGTEGYKLQVGQLIKKYPEYFGHLDAEKASHEDIRKALFFANNEMERKIRLMAQEKLAAKVADRSAELKLQIAEEQIANEERKRIAESSNTEIVSGTMGMYIKQRITYKEESDKLRELKLKDAQNDKLLQKVSNDLAVTQQEDYQVRRDAIIKKWNNKEFETRKEFTDAIKQLDLEYGFGSTKIAESTGKAKKDAAEKALKYQKESAEQALIMDEIFYLKEQESSRDNEIKIRTLQKQYDELRLKDSVGNANKKAMELTDIENDFQSDIADIKRRWNAREKVASERAEKEKNKAIEKEAMESAERLWKIINDRINDELKAKEKLQDELQKLDEKNSKDSIKLEEDKYKLMDKLRVLQAISKAKNSKDLIEIENKEKEDILKLNRDAAEKQLLTDKSKLYKMWLLKQENTVEYKEQQNVILKSEQDLTEAQIRLAEFVTDKTKDEIEKRKDIYVDMVNATDGFLDAISLSLNDSMGEANDLISKAQLESQQAIISIGKQGLSAISSFISGDYVGGALKAFGFLFNAVNEIGKGTQRLNEATLQKATNELNDYLLVVEKGVNKLISRIDDIREAYGEIKLESGATIGGTLSESLGLDIAMKNLWNLSSSVKSLSSDILSIPQFDFNNLFNVNATLDSWRLVVQMSGRSVDDLIQAEITRGQQIQKTYEIAVSKEKELYNQKVDNINKAFDLEVQNINKRYELESQKVKQKYNAETLAIVAAGSSQLEALITNEESLSSVRADFAAKRLAVEQAFPLASKVITENMTQAEIDAINESIKARDEQFAKIQSWYNDELIFIATSEGQKRKEYSDTEKIQNQIRDNLELAAIKFQASEIERERKKLEDIQLERDKADAKIEENKILRDAALLALENKKNEDIATSFRILTELLKVYSDDITKAMEDTAAKGTEAYRKLANELNAVNELLKQIKANTNSTPLSIGINGGITTLTPFERGTDNTSISLNGQPIVDNRGGKPAILHPDEAVFSKANMSEMTKALGYRPSRDEVIEKFKMGIVNMKLSHSPYVIPKLESKGIGNIDKLGDKIDSLVREVMKKQTPQIIMNERGIKTYLLGVNSKVQAKLDRFK